MSFLVGVTYQAPGLRMAAYVGSNDRNWLEGIEFVIYAVGFRNAQ